MTKMDLIKHWQNLFNIYNENSNIVNAGVVDDIHIYTDFYTSHFFFV